VQLPPVEWTNVRGMNSADPPTRLAPDVATNTLNILLEPMSLGRRRPSTAAVSLTSGPSSPIEQLVRYQPGVTKYVGSGGPELFAFSGTTTLHRLASSAWGSVTTNTYDTPTSWLTSRPYGATHNGKLFLAYDSTANRLHVWDGTSLKQVGLTATAAPTPTNDGAGAYAATLRYYKIQWRRDNVSGNVTRSELSAAVSFTPTGTGVLVTRPSVPNDTPDTWAVYGSADGVNYYELTTRSTGFSTYTDTAAPSTYSAGTIAPSAGLYVPPPSAKYLLAADNRLFMAGCHETSAGDSFQTSPRNSRVWFTQQQGALDNTGEDQAIAQTSLFKDYVDCGENDGDAITGLGGPLGGLIYVFKERSLWRLTPTGNAQDPYRSDQVSATIGATWQDGICLGEDGQGNPALYFMSQTGPKRIAQGYGVEDIGADIRSYTAASYSSVSSVPLVIWDAVRRVLWWLTYDAQSAYAFQPQFEQRTAEGVRGGWTKHTISSGGTTNNAVTSYEISTVQVPYIGGEGAASSAKLASLSGNAASDAAVLNLAPTIRSAIFQPAGLLNRVHFGYAVLEWGVGNNTDDFAHSVSVSSAIGGPIAVIGTVTDTATDAVYDQLVVQEKMESIALADVCGFQITVTWDTTEDGSVRPAIHGITIPVRQQEGA
jgi:hypothetical protein